MIILIGESGYIGNEFKRQLTMRGIQFKSNINANIHMSDVHECVEKCIINYKVES